jgi:hypothetical protein
MILDFSGSRCVIASIEFCYLVGRSHARLIAAIASAADTAVSNVTAHSTHAHDAPLMDEESHGLLARHGHNAHNEAYFAQVLNDTHAAVAAAVRTEAIAVKAVAQTSHPVHEFASKRRVIGSDGRCLTRWSICSNRDIRDAPCGKIDPDLRQVILFDETQKPVAVVHCYACHPQVSDGRGLVSGDAPGRAVELFSRAYPGIFSVYLTGCAGDITAGKYTTQNKLRNQILFGNRLFDAMDSAFLKAVPHALESVRWADQVFDLALAPVEQPMDDWEALMRRPSDGGQDIAIQYIAAAKAWRVERKMDCYPFRLSKLSLNGIDLLFCPAELLLEYQRFAQSLRPSVIVAAYGDSFLKYVAPAECFSQGGYEVEPLWTEVGPDSEVVIKDAIEHQLSS